MNFGACAGTVYRPMTVYDDMLNYVSPIQDCCKKQPKKKEHDMYNRHDLNVNVSADTSVKEDRSLEYIRGRLCDLQADKYNELRSHFEVGGKFPKTVKEAKEWLKSGNYRIELPTGRNDDTELGWYRSIHDYMKWGKTGPDVAAYEAATSELDKSYQSTLDTVNILSDEKERLQALKDFESKTFH